MFLGSRLIIGGLLLLTWLEWCLTGCAAEAAPSLDDLLKEYRKHELPLPPRKAKLVRYQSFDSGIIIILDKLQPRRKEYSLAFLTEPEIEKDQPTLLIGTLWCRKDEALDIRETAPDPDAAKDIYLAGEHGLILAVQCHALGWEKLARHALEQSEKEAKESPHKQLLHVAWVYWYGRLTDPKLDRMPAAKHLKELIGQDKEWDTQKNRALLKSLDLALTPRKSKPGSIEALIDDLVDCHADAGTIGIFEPEEPYWRIAKLGFDAVPALIEHLDDDRLTRAIMQGFNNFPSWHRRVGDVVSDLLEGLAGEDIGRDWLRRQQGYGVEKAEAKKWWDKAHKVGEETYLLDHVLGNAQEGEKGDVSAHLLNILLAKYPKHIPLLYRTVLDKRPDLDSWMLAKALVRCPLPNREKVDLLVYAAQHKDNHHRLPALEVLKDLDKKQFDTLLLATIESFPKDVSGPYWSCPEAYLASLAAECDDPRIWPTVERVARRSAVGFRMELFNRLNERCGDQRRTERVRLLAAFLDDSASRIEGSGKFSGPCAGAIYKKLEVRDFVALELASMLGINVEVKLDRTPEEWAKIRDQVREALKRQMRKPDTGSAHPRKPQD